MKRIALLLLFIACLPAAEATAQDLQDVVYLKNGSVIRGRIVEQVPDESLTVKTRDGSTFVIRTGDVERITAEPEVRIPDRKSPAVAFVFSLLTPGGGQIYNDHYVKAGVVLGASYGSVFALSLVDPADADHPLVAVASMAILVTYFAQLIEAPVSARRINRQRERLLQARARHSGGARMALAPVLMDRRPGARLSLRF